MSVLASQILLRLACAGGLLSQRRQGQGEGSYPLTLLTLQGVLPTTLKGLYQCHTHARVEETEALGSRASYD